jgi:hypothetical protein
MKKRNIFKYICLILYIICSTLIIVHSSLNGTASSNESNKVVNIFSFVLNKITKENNVYIDVNNIELNSEIKNTYLGETIKLDLNVLPSEASNKSLTFLSSDSNIASVDSHGNITFNNLGECEIKVISKSNSDVSLTLPIKVSYPTIDSYSILIDGEEYKENMALNYDTYHYIDVISDTHIYKCDYSSSSVKVNEYGAFYLNSNYSNFNIDIALNDNKNVSLKFNLGTKGKIKTITSYSLTSFNDKLYVNSNYDLNGSYLPSDGDINDLYFKVDNNYAEVKDNKLCIYKSCDNLSLEVISRSNGNKLFETSLNTYDVFPTEIKINNNLDNGVLSLSVLNSTKLNISFDEKATYKNVKYESGNTSLLVIDDNGLIQTLEKGETTIKIVLDYDGQHLEKVINVSIIRQPYIKDIATFSYWIRKLVGHFGLFMAMSLFGTLTYLLFIKKKYISYPISIGVSLFLACLSEFIQVFAGSRGPSFKDVGIDMLGACIPFIIILCIDLLIYFIKNKKDKKENL